jgi:hypothetical protein
MDSDQPRLAATHGQIVAGPGPALRPATSQGPAFRPATDPEHGLRPATDPAGASVPGPIAAPIPIPVPVVAPMSSPPSGPASGPAPASAPGLGDSGPPEPEPAPVPGPTYVYAIGRIEPRFPSLSVEREYAQVVARLDTTGQTDAQIMRRVLRDRENRYLARQMCWVFSVQGLPTYLVSIRDPADLDLLIDAVRENPAPTDVDVIIGLLGPLAPPEACEGLVLPIAVADQVYSFGRLELIDALPAPEKKADQEGFRRSAAEVLDRILQLADNSGATDEHRALNYLAVRYQPIYARTAQQHQGQSSLVAVEVRPSRLSGPEKIVDVVLSFRGRSTDLTEQFFVRVNVTGEFPFVLTGLQPFFER